MEQKIAEVSWQNSGVKFPPQQQKFWSPARFDSLCLLDQII